jgi:hypothetical protein
MTTSTLYRPGRPARALTHPRRRRPRVSSAPPGAAHLLPGAERGLRRPDRQRVEPHRPCDGPRVGELLDGRLPVSELEPVDPLAQVVQVEVAIDLGRDGRVSG